MGILKVECVLNGDVVKLEMPDDGDVWTCLRMYHPNTYDVLESGDIIGVTVEG